MKLLQDWILQDLRDDRIERSVSSFTGHRGREKWSKVGSSRCRGQSFQLFAWWQPHTYAHRLPQGGTDGTLSKGLKNEWCKWKVSHIQQESSVTTAWSHGENDF